MWTTNFLTFTALKGAKECRPFWLFLAYLQIALFFSALAKCRGICEFLMMCSLDLDLSISDKVNLFYLRRDEILEIPHSPFSSLCSTQELLISSSIYFRLKSWTETRLHQMKPTASFPIHNHLKYRWESAKKSVTVNHVDFALAIHLF